MTIIVSLKDKNTGVVKNITTTQADLHKTFWRYKEDFPLPTTHEVFVNGFLMTDAMQTRIAEAFNTPDMDFGQTFERGYWELYVLARQAAAIRRAENNQRRA